MNHKEIRESCLITYYGFQFFSENTYSNVASRGKYGVKIIDELEIKGRRS